MRWPGAAQAGILLWRGHRGRRAWYTHIHIHTRAHVPACLHVCVCTHSEDMRGSTCMYQAFSTAFDLQFCSELTVSIVLAGTHVYPCLRGFPELFAMCVLLQMLVFKVLFEGEPKGKQNTTMGPGPDILRPQLVLGRHHPVGPPDGCQQSIERDLRTDFAWAFSWGIICLCYFPTLV